jgi:uncharacterized protein
MINRPAYLEELKKWIDKPQIKIITGIRRAGKSTVLRLLKAELIRQGKDSHQLIYLNFESLANEHLKSAPAFYHYFKDNLAGGKKYYLLLDEIQEVDAWEKVVNSLLVDFEVDVYLTGSNSHLLSSDLATYIAGRYVEIPIYTLSFKEYLDFKQVNFPENEESMSSAFMDYLRKGGFPVIHALNYDEETAYKTVSDIYSSVLLRDTIQRYKIRDIELLERVIRFTFDNIGNTFSGKAIVDYFKSQSRKTDINTIYNYLYALEGAFVLHRVSRYNIKGKEILKTQEKFFVSDVALIYSMMGYRDRMIGGILENLVFLELKRRGYRVFIGKLGVQEIDFIGEKMGRKIYVQVAYKLESEATVTREYSPLLAVRDQFPKFVVTMDNFWKDEMEGVRHITIEEFLLMDKF